MAAFASVLLLAVLLAPDRLIASPESFASSTSFASRESPESPASPTSSQLQRQRGPQDFTRIPCREVRNLDAVQYWYWDGFFGFVDLHDFTYERWGRLRIEPTICFRIALVVIDDPRPKTAGYRQAVSELIGWLLDDADSSDESKLALDSLERITGEDFNSRPEWVVWWEQNEQLSMWSAREKRLEIVDDVRQADEMLPPDALLLEAEEYWFYRARGWVSESGADGDFMAGSLRIPPHGFTFRVHAEDLTDLPAKERGFRRALENLIVDGLVSEELHSDGSDSIIEQIRALTDESFADRESWQRWWKMNGGQLVLSADGTRLVVRD